MLDIKGNLSPKIQNCVKIIYISFYKYIIFKKEIIIAGFV